MTSKIQIIVFFLYPVIFLISFSCNQPTEVSHSIDTLYVFNKDTIVIMDTAENKDKDTIVVKDTIESKDKDTIVVKDTIESKDKDTVVVKDTVESKVRDTIVVKDTVEKIIMDTIKDTVIVTKEKNIIDIKRGKWSGIDISFIVSDDGKYITDFVDTINYGLTTVLPPDREKVIKVDTIEIIDDQFYYYEDGLDISGNFLADTLVKGITILKDYTFTYIKGIEDIPDINTILNGEISWTIYNKNE